MGKPVPLNPEALPRLRRYLPDRLWARWQQGDTAPGLAHLQAVLRAVLTGLPRRVAQARLADPKGPAVAGTFAQATLLFADIAGFTAMSERLGQLGREGAEVITGIVNAYFAAMLEIIARHGGDLLKFGGDALLVAFEGDEGAVRGCRAALEMQQAMDRFAVVETPQGTFHLQMTAGLGTGPLFLASLGSPDRLEFAVMGPVLEQMARAEDLARAGEVVVDRATREAAGATLAVQDATPGFYRLTAVALPPSPLASPPPPWPDLPADARWLLERLDALTPYLPAGVLERIVASPGGWMIEGEHRLVTVLFANFYGINAIIQALGPDRADEITAILNDHFTVMRDIVHRYGGIVNKVDTYAVGYRIMALFGAPIAHEDDPARAVHAALEMQEAMRAFASLATSGGRFSLKQRIGINTGYVFAGTLGSALRQEYSVMGDEVNLTSRLMGVAAEGQVLISQATARRVAGLFEWREQRPVKVKGKRLPVRTYWVRRGVVGRVEWATFRGGFFGRREEMAKAQALVEAALNGQGAVLDIAGDPGVGKTRLVAELSLYAGRRGMTTLRGAAVSYGRSLPYLPWTPILRALLGITEGNGEGRRQRRVRLIAALEEAGLADWAPIVGEVLGIEIAETPLTASLDPRLRQQRFFDVVLQLIQRRAERSPLLLVLDDVQWADATSLDLIAYVARNVATSPLLLVVLHRPDLEAPPWQAVPSCHRLHLEELDEEASLALARSVLDGDLSPPLRRLILDRAQGNPLFVEEVARTLKESGALRREPGPEGRPRWTLAGEVTGVQVPTTLTGLIMGRLDRLETTNRRLLQVASVIGVAFP
ncbi:MAG TPA: adenylate/guanylate cyclase domain-containing protein, partial [Chloroflexi bacterium]|nr:adenylate/guanylate cyclase domain-containing protein [Chloroflexota bacterium]